MSRNTTTLIHLAAWLAAAMPAAAQPDLPQKFHCVVRDAQILADRTHVRCANTGLNGLSEFAAETNQPYVNRVAAAIVQALRTGTPLILTYAPSIELNPEGCGVRNCRKIIDVGGPSVVPRPPATAALPAPRVSPEDFDPVDSVVNEPAMPPPAPRPAPKAPAVDPYRMRPISD